MKKTLNLKPEEVKHFREILKEANTVAEKAAQEAFDKLVKQGPKFSVHNADIRGNVTGPSLGTLLDVCGNGYILIKDTRSKFFKFIDHNNLGWRPSPLGKKIFLSTNYTLKIRQEFSIHEAAIMAMVKVLRNHPEIKFEYKTYVD